MLIVITFVVQVKKKKIYSLKVEKLLPSFARTDTPLYLHRISTVTPAGGRMLATVSGCSERQQAVLSCYCWHGPQSVSADTSVHMHSSTFSHKHAHFICDGQNRSAFCLCWWKNKREVTQWSFRHPRAPPTVCARRSSASLLPGVGANKFISSILPGRCSYAALFTVVES